MPCWMLLHAGDCLSNHHLLLHVFFKAFYYFCVLPTIVTGNIFFNKAFSLIYRLANLCFLKGIHRFAVAIFHVFWYVYKRLNLNKPGVKHSGKLLWEYTYAFWEKNSACVELTHPPSQIVFEIGLSLISKYLMLMHRVYSTRFQS